MRKLGVAVATGAVAFTLAQAVTPQAWGAGFALREQGALDQGSSYAGATARAQDPSTLFYNPAGITHLPGYQVSVNTSYIDPQATLTSGSGSRAAIFGGVPFAGSVGTDAGIGGKTIGSAYVTAQLTERLFAGLAVTVPYGLTTKYPTSSIARYYALTSALQVINIAPTIAFKVTPNLSLAATLQIETADSHLSNAVDFGGIGAASGLARFGFLPGTADGIATVKGSDVSVGWQVSALYDVTAGTRVGLNYRSAMFHTLTGSVQYQNVPTPFAPVFANGPGSAKLVEPDSVSIGASHDIGAFTLLADASWTNWSRFKTLTAFEGSTPVSTTIENWHDTYFVAVGADYRLNDKLTLRAGTAFDEGVTGTATRTPRIPDSNRYWLSVGATYRPMPWLDVSAAYSHLFADTARVNLVDAGPGTTNFLRGNLNASYDAAVDIVSLQTTARF